MYGILVGLKWLNLLIHIEYENCISLREAYARKEPSQPSGCST